MLCKFRISSFVKLGLMVFIIFCAFQKDGYCKEKARVMVLIEEKVAGMFGTTAWEKMGEAEAVVMEKFIAAGFNVVDPKTVKASITRDEALTMISGDARASAVAGLQYGAQFVVIGKALSKNAGGGILNTTMQSLQASIQARVIRTDDSAVIASGSAQAAKAHIDELQGGVLAIKEASNKLADTLIQDIRKSEKPATRKTPRQINLIITGLVSYRHLMAVRNLLEKDIYGVKTVQQLSYTAGTAELIIDYTGKASQIADIIANTKFTGFRIEPENVTATRLDLRAVLDKK